MRLDQLSVGQNFTVTAISDPHVRLQALRMGFGEGACATLQAAVPGGPVVLCRGCREFALGRALARGIEVQPAATGGAGRGCHLS